MDRIARLNANDRRDIFLQSAAQLGVRPTIIEKDFWVCFVLNKLFTESEFRDYLVFKGGTSLSKAYRLIERFSEDVDLVLDWGLIASGQPLQVRQTRTQQYKFNKDANHLAGQFIKENLGPHLDKLLRQADVGVVVAVDKEDAQVVNIAYPATFSETYIRPEVRLEIGPLAAQAPSAIHSIAPYAANVFPNLFHIPSVNVRTITAERTFWEKATILHQEAHRVSLTPPRYSRHYYDVFKLAQSPVLDTALADLDLLRNVVRFKELFYFSAWSRYDFAVPGSFKLLPMTDKHLASLERDYDSMQTMLFGDRPSFADIIQTLRRLELRINELR